MHVVLKGGVEWCIWYVWAYVFLCMLERQMVWGVHLRGGRVTFWGPVRRLFAVVLAVEVAMQWDLEVFKRLG